MGRDVQNVVQGITKQIARDDKPSVKVHVTPVIASPDGEGSGEVRNSTRSNSSVPNGTHTAGQQVLEAVQKRYGKKSTAKMNHFQGLIQEAAQSAAEGAVQRLAKMEIIVTPHILQKKAHEAAQAAAKRTILAEVHKMAATAAKQAKEALRSKGADLDAQSDAASGAASQAATKVLTMANAMQQDVVKEAVRAGVKHMQRILDKRAQKKTGYSRNEAVSDPADGSETPPKQQAATAAGR